jgi:hypothetical protein
MVTVRCFQCPVTCDSPDRELAIESAHRHARDYCHNVGVYASESLAQGVKRELLAIVLKWRTGLPDSQTVLT